MARQLLVPRAWSRRKLSIVPLELAGGHFAFAEPVFLPQIWPETGWPSRAVLLDFDPWRVRSRSGKPDLPSRRVADQQWPEGTASIARENALQVSKGARKIPWVARSVTKHDRDLFIHDLVLGFVGSKRPYPGLREWALLRRSLHRRHLSKVRQLPTNCEAVVYFTEDDMAFVRTVRQASIVTWIAELIATRFATLAAHDRAKARAVARWIISEGVGRGVTISSIRPKKGLQDHVTISGLWGRNPATLATGLGEAASSRFRRVIRVERNGVDEII